MLSNIIYMILIIIKCISIVVITFLFQKQIYDLNKEIHNLKYQNFALATKLYSIQNNTFSNRKKSLEKCEKNTKSR